LEHEIIWKALRIPPNLLVEPLRRNAVKLGQIAVEHHFFATYEQNRPLDSLRRN
jgi:hypothetical protein